MGFKKFLSYFFLTFILILCFFIGIYTSILNNHNLVDFSVLESNSKKPSILLDDEGNEWARFELDRRENIKFDDLPKHLVQAFLASEDREFFNHSGISYKGILRSFFVNLYHGKIVQGASTITQQLVKLLFFDSQKTFKRKIKEQFFSLIVESQFSKQQILETYLNHVYFGCGIYGVEAASQRFFGKSVKNISIAQAATLAAVVRSPANYCPLLSPISAQKRRDLILNLMHNLRFISEFDFKEAIKEQINVKCENKKVAQHLKESIRIFLEEKVGKQNLYCGGLKIQTTLNQKIQKIGEVEFNKQIEKLRKEINPQIDGGLICMENKSGEIKALIGGYNFCISKFNRTLAKRQMGSIFKPILYACALDNGMKFNDVEIDEPIEINFEGNKWNPQNYTREFEGQMTLVRALSYSNNTISAKILLKIGCKKFVEFAEKFRFKELNPYPSLALGCVDATLIESTAAFNVFANNGCYVEPHFIKWIKDENGTKIFKTNNQKEQIISNKISDQVAKVLSIGLKRYVLRIDPNIKLNFDAIGKTGTTNDSRNCWFAGSCPNYTTGIYIGCDNNSSMGENIFGVRTAFPIWLSINQQIEHPIKNFSYDPSLKEVSINWKTGYENNDLLNPDVVQIYV